ncbi:MAG TPA: lysoplasmalogenase family protein [Candidatus Limiplasma sp.]|nr:lysoplasmalogenase family protein [Candidatus Limiplasma sp.]HPS81455.1 lysoplasmalogenase family protein [Candidatus Limiplasma sp.]
MPYWIAGYASVWLVWMPLRFHTRARGYKRLSAACKIVPTCMAACLAGWACFAQPNADGASYLLWLGVCVGALADVAIDFRLEWGGVLFFAAHCLYVAALLQISPPNGWFAVTALVAFAAALKFLYRYRARFAAPLLRVGVLLYAAALSALLAAALPAPFAGGGLRPLLGAVGAVLFVISDATLCRNAVAHRLQRAREAQLGITDPRAARRRLAEGYLSLGCYYTAQTVLALCAFSGLSVW